jgi:lysophospholipase L1-like esterase
MQLFAANSFYLSHRLAIIHDSLVIPTYDLFKNNLSFYLTADNFHPNSKGYKAIANRIADAIGND